MDASEINASCKSTIFKSVLTDVIYSFRMSVKKLTGATADIKLNKIRVKPINIHGGTVVVGSIRNLVGGKIACVFDNPMVEFLHNETEYDSERFALDFFDCFSTTSKNGMLELNTDSVEINESAWENSIYYIRFDTKLLTETGKIIPSKFVISVDEITSMYFRD
jgi:hypothetical protein